MVTALRYKKTSVTVSEIEVEDECDGLTLGPIDEWKEESAVFAAIKTNNHPKNLSEFRNLRELTLA